MNKEQLLGSQTAKNGFKNEDDIIQKFNNWENDNDSQNEQEIILGWLNNYKLLISDILKGRGKFAAE